MGTNEVSGKIAFNEMIDALDHQEDFQDFISAEEAINQMNTNFKMIAEGLENLAKRLNILEDALQKMPPPGADGIQFKPPGEDEYKNLAETFKDLYDRINTIETVVGI